MDRLRSKPYKEDSTKGRSLINPMNYKGDVLVQVWIDSRVLATLCRWLDNAGFYSRFMSQVVRRPLEVLAEHMVENGEVEVVDDTAEARVMLERRFGVDLNRGGRGTKNVQHNVSLSVRRAELDERIQREKRVYDVNRPRKSSNPLVERALEAYERLYGNGEKAPEIVSRGVRDDMTIVRPEDTAAAVEKRLKEKEVERQEAIFKEQMTTEEIAARIKASDKFEEEQMNALDNLDPSQLKPIDRQ